MKTAAKCYLFIYFGKSGFIFVRSNQSLFYCKWLKAFPFFLLISFWLMYRGSLSHVYSFTFSAFHSFLLLCLFLSTLPCKWKWHYLHKWETMSGKFIKNHIPKQCYRHCCYRHWMYRGGGLQLYYPRITYWWMLLLCIDVVLLKCRDVRKSKSQKVP